MNLLALIRSAVKVPILFTGLFIYFIVSFLVYVFCGFDFIRARPYLTKVISLTSVVGLTIIGIKVVQNIHPIDPDENYLIVSNHLSYTDILIISRYYPSCFVTSVEMRETFFLGQICLLGGCLFVDRKNKSNIHKEVKELSSALGTGLNVAIFPEAKSTDGTSVIRFRRPLFQAAIDSHSKVLPICLNYKKIDGAPVTLQNRDKVFWYGEKTFLAHFLTLCSCKEVLVELTVLPSLLARDFTDKTALAEKCHELISDQYDNVIS